MAGGDMRIQMNYGLVGVQLPGAKSIAVDANSVKSGNMTEPRQVKGEDGKPQTVFLTPEGAKIFDANLNKGPMIYAEKDPNFLYHAFVDTSPPEQGLG
ncbi:MAG TPA: hypothetical protein V6D23_01700, partial [Candidatus Obscuribacterales bacterium]